RMAVGAARNDRRFLPVAAAELPELTIEISVLTPPARVRSPAAIQPGRDGVLLEQSGRQAVFLPQVATEQGWGRDELLSQLCLKAGLAPGCWRQGARLSTFQADVFGTAQDRP
ncbi:MAG TPA: AmmeMemoRadiSam system protein A, partial [Thermoanaerobaculia bacterium]|nr:AmmeMemoRadiSam system protein A [Thermoanaerobaculia bacterium]